MTPAPESAVEARRTAMNSGDVTPVRLFHKSIFPHLGLDTFIPRSTNDVQLASRYIIHTVLSVCLQGYN